MSSALSLQPIHWQNEAPIGCSDSAPVVNDNVLAMVCVTLFVCANHFTLLQSRGSAQSWLCLDTDPRKRISPSHMGPSNCTQATGKCRRSLIVCTVAEEL